MIPGLLRAAFNGVEFHRYITDGGVRDEFGPGFVAHQIPHYSGAKQEEIGGPPHRTHFDLVFSGRDWRAQVSEILAPMIARPRGPLTHPVYGKLMMVLKAPITAALDPVRKGGRYDVGLQFEQDSLSTDIIIQKGPAALAQDVTDRADAADTAATSWKDLIYSRNTRGPQALLTRQKATTALGAVSTFTAAARDYSAAALAQFNSGTWDPTLENRLHVMPSLVFDAATKVRALAPLSVYTPDIVTEMEMAAKASLDMQRAIKANLPPPVEVPITAKVSLFVLVGRLYPSKTRDQRIGLMEHIQRVNRLTRADVLMPGRPPLVVPAP